MAAPAVTFAQRHAMMVGATPFGTMGGTVNVTSYDNTHPAVTAITGKTRRPGALVVVPDAVSSLGFAITWDPVTTSFKAYSSNGAAPAALAEVANATNVGTFGFTLLG